MLYLVNVLQQYCIGWLFNLAIFISKRVPVRQWSVPPLRCIDFAFCKQCRNIAKGTSRRDECICRHKVSPCIKLVFIQMKRYTTTGIIDTLESGPALAVFARGKDVNACLVMMCANVSCYTGIYTLFRPSIWKVILVDVSSTNVNGNIILAGIEILDSMGICL